ncbi:MAG: type II secretion system protein [Candidatus Omnitrophota bacterium]
MKKNFAFTLLELLIVLAILGILVSLILPKFENIRESANQRTCTANLKALANAMVIYEEAANNGEDVLWGEISGKGKTQINAKFPNFLVDRDYLALEPRCPIGDVRYRLYQAGDGDHPENVLDYADCVNENAKAGTYTDHRWPF